MKLSFTGPAMRHMDRHVGYGEASWNIYNQFAKAGIQVDVESKDADVELCFADPGNYNFLNKDSYKIVYSAWESTGLKPQYLSKMNRADEIWATSPWVEQVYKENFPNKKIFTYKHGIHTDWAPRKRTSRNSPFTFLHIGEPYSRKDAQLAVDTFIKVFGDDPNYRLILKCSGMNTTKVSHPKYGYLASPSALYENIITIENFIPSEQMVALYRASDVFLYPTWGEGFGFQPLQALASGMPVISTAEWADYRKYITWEIDSHPVPSPWPDTHQGLMYKPNQFSLEKVMRQAPEDYDDVLQQTFRNAFMIHREYDWAEVTKPAVQRINEIFATRH